MEASEDHSASAELVDEARQLLEHENVRSQVRV